MRYAMTAMALGIVCSAAPAARAGETERIGGPGGEKTVRMDCGANGFITGIYARSGRYIGYDAHLVRDLSVTCTPFDGSTVGASPPRVEAKYGHSQEMSKSVQCPKGVHAIHMITVKAGLYIDRVKEASCRDTTSMTGSTGPMPIEVGGNGGLFKFLACPSGQALYRLDARTGDAIDSLQGFCRRFPPPNPESVAQAAQITSSLAPKPPFSLPASGAYRQLQFNVPSAMPWHHKVLFQVTASATGGMTPSIAYRMEFVDPTGAITKSTTASSSVTGVSINFPKAGNWTLKLRNLNPGAAVGIQSILVTGEAAL